MVILRKDIPEENLQKGMIGTIVLVYNEPNLPIGYEVEFVNEQGETISVVTLNEKDIEHKLK